MKKTESKVYSTRGIIGKVISALLLSVLFLTAAVLLTRDTFKDVNQKIDRLSDPAVKIASLNDIYLRFSNLERVYQAPLFANPYSSSNRYVVARDSLISLIDSAITYVPFDYREINVLDSVQKMIINQSDRLMAYRAIKRREQPFLKQNLDSLIRLLSADAMLHDTSVVTTEKKFTTISSQERQDEDEAGKEKKHWLQRLFGGGNDEEMADTKKQAPRTVEETRIKVDTVSVSSRDTSAEIAGAVIRDIERGQNVLLGEARNAEINILQGSASIQGFMLSLIRDVDEMELSRVRTVSSDANFLMDRAVLRMFTILGIFAILATLLVFAILNDVAKSKFYRLQLIDEKERAEELGRVKERFLANMSHEIRTPLQNIIGYSENIKTGTHKEEGEIIFRSSEHLLQIVNEVLDYSRISTGRLSLKPKDFDLEQLVQEVIRSIDIQARKKGIRLLYQPGILHTRVSADPFRIRQVLYNLLGNAIKFTDKGFVQLRTQTEIQKGSIKFDFDVEDTGIGMSATEIERLFMEFEQGDSDKASAGTGLGLSIAKALVEAYDGNIDVESEKEKGTVFKVTMTLRHPAEEISSIQKAELFPKRKNVLAVDDDEIILNLIQKILMKQGIEVTTTTLPTEAIELAKTRAFDIVLVDYRMPKMTGGELREAIKKIKPDLDVVAVTANVMQLEGATFAGEEFDGFLSKPFVASQLLEILGYEPDKKGDFNDAFHSKLESVTMGDEALALEIRDQFKKDGEKDMLDLEEALETLNCEKIREVSHKLAGRLGLFEMNKLANAFKVIENQAQDGRLKAETASELRRLLPLLKINLSNL